MTIDTKLQEERKVLAELYTNHLLDYTCLDQALKEAENLKLNALQKNILNSKLKDIHQKFEQLQESIPEAKEKLPGAAQQSKAYLASVADRISKLTSYLQQTSSIIQSSASPHQKDVLKNLIGTLNNIKELFLTPQSNLFNSLDAVISLDPKKKEELKVILDKMLPILEKPSRAEIMKGKLSRIKERSNLHSADSKALKFELSSTNDKTIATPTLNQVIQDCINFRSQQHNNDLNETINFVFGDLRILLFKANPELVDSCFNFLQESWQPCFKFNRMFANGVIGKDFADNKLSLQTASQYIAGYDFGFDQRLALANCFYNTTGSLVKEYLEHKTLNTELCYQIKVIANGFKSLIKKDQNPKNLILKKRQTIN